jgi:hypothetical protein
MLPDGPPPVPKCNLNEIVNRPQLITKDGNYGKIYTKGAKCKQQHYIKSLFLPLHFISH